MSSKNIRELLGVASLVAVIAFGFWLIGFGPQTVTLLSYLP